MASAIDATKPVQNERPAISANLRANFLAAKNEIEYLQANLLSVTAANVVQLNSIDDMPAAVAGDRLSAGQTRYILNNTIDIGSDKFTLRDGSTIEGWSAQRCEIRSSGPITIDTEPSVTFATCIIKGPVRIRNTNASGKAVNVSANVFLIQEGANTIPSVGGVGIYTAGCAALYINRWSCSNAANALLVEGPLGFGATIIDYNAQSVIGNGLNFNGVAGVTDFNLVTIRGAISRSGGIGFRLVGKAVVISMDTSSRFESTGNTAGYIENTAVGRIGSFQLNGAAFVCTGGANKHGLDISNAFFNSMTYYIGQCSTAATGTSYGIFGQLPAGTPFSTRCVINGVVVANSVTPANTLGGMTSADYKVEVTGCPGVSDSATTGVIFINTTSPTEVIAAPNVVQDLGSASIASAYVANTSFERTTPQVNSTDFSIVITDPTPKLRTISYSIECLQSINTTQTQTFTLVRFRDGVATAVDGSIGRIRLTNTTISAGISKSIPVRVQENDRFYLSVSSTAALTLTFLSLDISVGN